MKVKDFWARRLATYSEEQFFYINSDDGRYYLVVDCEPIGKIGSGLWMLQLRRADYTNSVFWKEPISQDEELYSWEELESMKETLLPSWDVSTVHLSERGKEFSERENANVLAANTTKTYVPKTFRFKVGQTVYVPKSRCYGKIVAVSRQYGRAKYKVQMERAGKTRETDLYAGQMSRGYSRKQEE